MRFSATRGSTKSSEDATRAACSSSVGCARLHVSGLVFSLSWWSIFCMHLFNGTLALAFSAIYLFFSLPEVYPTIIILEVPLSLLRISGWSYLALGASHWYALCCLVAWSSRTKRLTLRAPPASSSATRQNLCTSLVWLKNRAAVLYRWIWAPWNRLFGIDGFFGVNGMYFNASFFAREALEVVLQTYQANQLSRAVRRAWITDLAVATVVLNAISSPLARFLLRRQGESVRRIMSILVDMCLDFCSAAIIPLCVVYPFLAGYDARAGTLPVDLIYDDSRFIASIAEIRQFCVTSAADLLATMMPHVTVLSSLNMAKRLIRRRTHTHPLGQPQAASRLKRVAQSVVYASRVVPARVAGKTCERSIDSEDSVGLPDPQQWLKSASAERLLKMLSGCTILWALGVIVIHTQSIQHAKSVTRCGCRRTLSAWLTSNVPCAVIQINCFRDNISGVASEISSSLEPLDRSLLKKVIFTHCPVLEIPPSLGEFNAVSEIDVYNSTLSWSKEAAATPTSLSSLINFNWLACPYIRFPEGLLHHNLPKSFARFVLSKSNMTELPDALGTEWAGHQLDVFSVQLASLRRLPVSFGDLKMEKLRIISTNVSEIADNALANKAIRVLHLSGNPIQKWPSTLGDTSGLVELMVEHTLLASISDEVIAWWKAGPHTGLRPISFSLFGSPMCENASRDEVDPCRIDHKTADGTHRWDLIEVQRSLDL